MNQLRFDFTANRKLFAEQEYIKLLEDLALSRKEQEKLRKKVKEYNSLSRGKK